MRESFFYPKEGYQKGLKELILFPDGEFKRANLPNSSVWVYDAEDHEFICELLGTDVGCGISVFITDPIYDIEGTSDIIAKYLKGSGDLGGGNHFVDICSSIDGSEDRVPKDEDYNLILIHTGTGRNDNPKIETLEDAVNQVNKASKHRRDMMQNIAHETNIDYAPFGDWPHNFVEQVNGEIIYRKGIIKADLEKPYHVLPASIASSIIFYIPTSSVKDIRFSMPHGTGRRGPISMFKADLKEARDLRKTLYIPKEVSDSSLRGEHPKGYNNIYYILDKVAPYLAVAGESKILSYIGKV